MNIAVFTDKFSGTLTAYEVIDVIKENFFKHTFECGVDGLNQPKHYLSKATKELIKILQMD